MKKIWILTVAKRGFLQKPEIYYDKQTADKRKLTLLKDFSPDYDEIDVFEKMIRI